MRTVLALTLVALIGLVSFVPAEACGIRAALVTQAVVSPVAIVAQPIFTTAIIAQPVVTQQIVTQQVTAPVVQQVTAPVVQQVVSQPLAIVSQPIVQQVVTPVQAVTAFPIVTQAVIATPVLAINQAAIVVHRRGLFPLRRGILAPRVVGLRLR